MKATAEQTTRYDTEVTAVGELVRPFADQGMLIFFADSAPAELHEFAILHHPTLVGGGVCPGDEVVIDDRSLRILAVGELAEQNLVNLGHLNLKANGETVAPLPGDICVEAARLTVPAPGCRIRIRSTDTMPSE